jgi:hypothetical protein
MWQAVPERKWDATLTNFFLLPVALVSVGGAGWLSVKRTSAAAAPAVLAGIMLLLALGGPLGVWSKYVGGTGLPETVKAAAFGESKAAAAFLWASIGAGLSAVLVPAVPPQALPPREVQLPKNFSLMVAVVSSATFLAYLVGEGPSFLRREVYLQNDGVMFLVHFWPLGVLCAITGIALTVWEEDRRLRLFLIATAALWFIAQASLGSRTACAGPMVGGSLIIYNEIRRRRLHLPMIAAALTLLATAIFTFSAVNKAREMPHGVLNVFNVVQATAADMRNSTDSILMPAKQLAASVVVGFPDAEESARYAMDPGVLIDNANPLPGTAQPPELERYWPYEWVPLCFAGEWFGAMGWLGQVLLFGAIGLLLALSMRNLLRSRFRLFSFLPVGFAAFIGVLSIEYPSRMVWRVISLALIFFIASYLLRERSRRVVCTPLDDRPRNADGDLEESVNLVGWTPKVPMLVPMTIGQRYG